MITESLLVLFAYLLGSVSTAIITCKLLGLPDPRSQGSNNPGATNVLRIGGKKAAIITLIGDLLKGLIPVLIAHAFGADKNTLALVAFFAFIGHLYPVFFHFKGGKGVATSLGVLLGLSWPVALAVTATWGIMAYAFKISSLSALTAATLTPLFMWIIEPSPAYLIFSCVLSILLIWRHRSNIINLIKGKET